MQFIDLKKQQSQLTPDGLTIREAINYRISNVLDHGQFILGPEVEELEKTLSKFVEVNHCIAVASGTDALLLSLMALGVKPGDEIVTTPFSFIATVETILLLGAIPIFADIDPKTYNLDPKKIEEVITRRTKAILAVSLYGQPANFEEINAIAESYNLPVIEDGAQSFGSMHKGKKSCSLSTIGTTSFFPSKPLGGYGDSGACFTDNDELAEKIRRISRHGQIRRYVHSDIGINGRIDTLQAAIILAKWPNFEKEVQARSEIGSAYSSKLNHLGIISTPYVEEYNSSVYAQYTILVDHRDHLQNLLKIKGVPTAVHYPSLLCNQEALLGFSQCQKNPANLEIAISVSEKVMSLPMHPWLSSNDQDKVVQELATAMKSCMTFDSKSY